MYKLTKQGNEITKRKRKRKAKKPKEEDFVNEEEDTGKVESFVDERHQADGASEASSAAHPTSQMQQLLEDESVANSPTSLKSIQQQNDPGAQ